MAATSTTSSYTNMFNQQTTLDLVREWGINAQDARDIAEALKVEGCSITTLNLDGGRNKIKAEGARLIAEALKVNQSLTTLNLGDNDIGTEGARHIAEALKVNHSIRTLDLDINHLGTEGARYIAKALKVKGCSITTLNLRSNDIGNEGARYIAKALKVNRSITTLNLGDNQIGAEGARYIAEALKVEGCSITTLNLGSNQIGNEGVRYIAEALKVNHSITTLDLYNNDIEPEGAQYIAEALKVEGCSITFLELSTNYIGARGARYIAEALKVNHSIRTLDLNSNHIGTEGARDIAEALKVNHSITTLLLGGNYVGHEEDHVIYVLLRERQKNKGIKESSLLSTPLSDIISDRFGFFVENNYRDFPSQRMRSLQSNADKHDIPSEYSSSLANLYKAIMSESFPSYDEPVPHKLQEVYNSLSPQDKILIDHHIWVLSGKPLGEEGYGASHAFENQVKFYAAVYNAILFKYVDMLQIKEQRRAIYRHIYKLALHANDLIERRITTLRQLRKPEVFAEEWGSRHAKENFMRLALAMAIAEKPAASSSSTASSSGPASSALSS